MLHSEKRAGDSIELAAQVGEFFINQKARNPRPLVLIEAGVAVTPILTILATSLETMPGREVIFIHGCLSENVQPFEKTIERTK